LQCGRCWRPKTEPEESPRASSEAQPAAADLTKSDQKINLKRKGAAEVCDERVKPSLGIGVILATLISLVLFLFGITNYVWLAVTLLLFNGIWIAVYGLVEAETRDKLFYGAWGLIMAGLSSFAVLPLTYTLGLTLVLIMVVIGVRLVGGSAKQGA
jgi:hypothetical protein